jgi:enoyl-CoA hydratase/carnithine racemase
MLPYRQIIYEKQEALVRVKMNRPRYRNAQSRILLEELDRAFTEAVADEEVRVIILSGEGDHFSSGHDLGTPDQKEDDARRPYVPGILGQYQKQWGQFHDMGMRWRELPKPTIAEVHGYCIFGGWLIASAMDIITAADDALFLPSLLQYFSVPWDIGVRKAKEILFQMRFIDAREACQLGFVNLVVSRKNLREETTKMAERIAEADPIFTRLAKLSINQVQDAAGFRVAAQSAFSNYMIFHQAGLVRTEKEKQEGKRSLSRVDRALAHLKK